MRFGDLLVPFFTVLFIFIFFYGFTFLFGPIPLSVNSLTTTKTDLFSVSAEEEASATGNEATFTVGVTKNTATVEDAKDQVNKAIHAIIAEMKRLGVEEKDIMTENLSINPEYDFTTGRQIIRGYAVSQNLRVKASPIEKANQALDAAVANGANVVYGVTFAFDDEEREALEAKAREEAIKKAKKKAQTIAKAAGIRLGRIVNIQEAPSGQGPIPVMMEARGGDTQATEPTDLQPGENTVRISVTLFYETL